MRLHRCLAACVETLHNASLVLDDFQDAALRQSGSILRCISMFGRCRHWTHFASHYLAFVSLSQIKISPQFPALTAEVHQAVADTILGQTWDQDGNKNTGVDQVKQTAALKSGPLFGLSLSLPLIAAGHATDSVATLYRLGELFGLGYQALDIQKDRATDRLQAVDANIVNAFESDRSLSKPKWQPEIAYCPFRGTSIGSAMPQAGQGLGD